MNITLEKSARGKNLIINPPLKLQVPRSHLPYGFNEFKPQNDYQKSSVNVQFLLNDDEFISRIHEIEATVIEKVCKMYNGSLDASHFNSNYRNGRLRVKYVENYSKLFDSNGKLINKEPEDKEYEKWSAAANVTIDGVYFMNQKFGLIWKANQVKLYETRKLTGYCFLSDSDDE